MPSIAFFQLLDYEIHLSRNDFPREMVAPVAPPTDLQALLYGPQEGSTEVTPSAPEPFIGWAQDDASTFVWVGDWELIVSRLNSGG